MSFRLPIACKEKMLYISPLMIVDLDNSIE
jgi:hypothetical protein